MFNSKMNSQFNYETDILTQKDGKTINQCEQNKA
jgi:hypothetical protein